MVDTKSVERMNSRNTAALALASTKRAPAGSGGATVMGAGSLTLAIQEGGEADTKGPGNGLEGCQGGHMVARLHPPDGGGGEPRPGGQLLLGPPLAGPPLFHRGRNGEGSPGAHGGKHHPAQSTVQGVLTEF